MNDHSEEIEIARGATEDCGDYARQAASVVPARLMDGKPKCSEADEYGEGVDEEENEDECADAEADDAEADDVEADDAEADDAEADDAEADDAEADDAEADDAEADDAEADDAEAEEADAEAEEADAEAEEAEAEADEAYAEADEADAEAEEAEAEADEADAEAEEAEADADEADAEAEEADAEAEEAEAEADEADAEAEAEADEADAEADEADAEAEEADAEAEEAEAEADEAEAEEPDTDEVNGDDACAGDADADEEHGDDAAEAAVEADLECLFVDCTDALALQAEDGFSAEESAEKVVSWLWDESWLINDSDVTQLKGLLNLYNVVVGNAEIPDSSVLEQFIESGAASAARFLQETRERHPHCSEKAMTHSNWLSLRATELANYLAMQEESGCADIALNRDTALLRFKHQDGVERLKVGLAICRFDGIFARICLPYESIWDWYKHGQCYPYDDTDSVSESQHVRFAQLLDPSSLYLGWGAAMALTGGIYAVALFDHIAAADAATLAAIQPSTSETCPAESDFDCHATLFKPIGQMFSALSAVFRLFSDKFAFRGLPNAKANCASIVARVHDAVRRLRRRHGRSVPISVTDALASLAFTKANELALAEDEGGDDQGALEAESMEFPELGAQLGFLCHRMEPCGDIVTECWEFWTRGEEGFPQADPEEAFNDLQYRQLAQLVDREARYMGFGAAKTESGAVYAVALFDSVWQPGDSENVPSAEPDAEDGDLPDYFQA